MTVLRPATGLAPRKPKALRFPARLHRLPRSRADHSAACASVAICGAGRLFDLRNAAIPAVTRATLWRAPAREKRIHFALIGGEAFLDRLHFVVRCVAGKNLDDLRREDFQVAGPS